MAPEKDSLSARLLNWLGLDKRSGAESTVLLKSEPRGIAARQLPEHVRDRYEILRVIGQGAFGTVYLARDTRIGRLIAVKQLFAEYHSKSEILDLFLQEARIAGQLENANIVSIFDVEDDGHSACIVMEYLAGGHLRKLLDLDGPLNQEAALLHVQGILNGLGAAHAMGVVHRDIKPQNILYDQNGTPKISDFGVASLPLHLSNTAEDSSTSAAGTPNYMAPEQFQYGVKVDARTDIYSVGLMFYECLTNERVFNFTDDMDLKAIGERIMKSDPARTLAFPDRVSTDVQDIVLKMIQRTPADRYPDCRSAMTEIEAVLADLHGTRTTKTSPDDSNFDRVEMFADVMRLFLVDGVISAPERRELQRRAQRLDISPDVARGIEDRIRREQNLPQLRHLEEFQQLTERLLADGDFGREDERLLRRLGAKYGISLDEQKKIEDAVLTKFHMK